MNSPIKTAGTDDELCFKRRYFAWALSAGFGVFLLIGCSGLVTQRVGSGSFMFFAGLTVLSLFLVIRILRMAIIAKRNSVLIRGFLRSRRIPIEKIREIEAVSQPNMYGMTGVTIAFRTVDGTKIVAGEFWSPTGPSGNAPKIDAIVRQLTSWRARRAVHRSPEVGTGKNSTDPR